MTVTGRVAVPATRDTKATSLLDSCPEPRRIFESDDFVLRGRPDLSEYVKPNAGFTIRVVPPGRPADLYHAESVEEDFLILMGECVLIIEDQERRLRPWDFVHCPPMTAHTLVATEAVPCVRRRARG